MWKKVWASNDYDVQNGNVVLTRLKKRTFIARTVEYRWFRSLGFRVNFFFLSTSTSERNTI